MLVLSSSVREVTARQTVEAAWPVAQRLGVTRYSETTRLDRIGIPVFSASRPRAGIVCVTAGKGQHAIEAHAGALMEAIEQAVAEYAGEHAASHWATPAEIVGAGGPTLGSLCPRIDRPTNLEEILPWVVAHDLATGAEVPVPPELVFIPCPDQLYRGYFGSTTTGLASGNTLSEAILHGLCEVIERDATSFHLFEDTSVLVDPCSLPPETAALHQKIANAGLRVWLRWAPSAPGIPYFRCLIVDDEFDTPVFCNGGYGCHPVSEIAAVRALSEAAQSRLSFIQGSRDDLSATHDFVDSMSPDGRRTYREQLIAQFCRSEAVVKFADISAASPAEPADLLTQLTADCRAAGLPQVVVYRYPALAAPFHVVRVLVPLAEHCTTSTRRVGPRLLAFSRRQRALSSQVTA